PRPGRAAGRLRGRRPPGGRVARPGAPAVQRAVGGAGGGAGGARRRRACGPLGGGDPRRAGAPGRGARRARARRGAEPRQLPPGRVRPRGGAAVPGAARARRHHPADGRVGPAAAPARLARHGGGDRADAGGVPDGPAVSGRGAMAPARRWSGASVAALATALAGCGSSSASSSTSPSALSAEAIEVPERRPTAGERLLELAPAGADALLEIDLARLRDNAQVGPLVRAVTGGGARAGLLAASDLLVFVSYRVGHDDAAQLVLAPGPRTGELAGARAITGDVVAIGPPALLDRVAAVVEGREPALAGDLELRRTRALAMPERAEGASVRMAARLGFDARVALASELDIEAVPAWLSIWLDVADDLALVALLGGDGEATPEELAQ